MKNNDTKYGDISPESAGFAFRNSLARGFGLPICPLIKST